MAGTRRRRLVIQERDRRLFTELAIMRVVDREQAKTVAGFGSTTRANTRLLALTKAGLLRRFFIGTDVRNRKALYSLSPKAAVLIGTVPRGPRRPTGSMVVADYFVLHQLAINDIYCRLKYSSAILGVSFRRWQAFYEPLASGLRLIPDGYVELNTLTHVTAAFVEVDLGHERLAVWKKKIADYLQFALSGDCERRFGREQFRVIVIANTERRLDSIRKVVRSSTQKIFWFATTEAIQSKGFFAPIWLRPEGDELQSFIIP